MSKPYIVGFGAVRDEIACIEGWFTNLCAFCDEVWALYDPRSTDGTTEWLIAKAAEDPRLNLWEQETEIGDSTRFEKGQEGRFNFAVSINRFLESLPENTWCLLLAPDERIDPALADYYWQILTDSEPHHSAIVMPIYDYYPDDRHIAAYERAGFAPKAIKFLKRTPTIFFGEYIHEGFGGITEAEMSLSPYPFYHFGHLIKNKDACWWRQENGLHLLKCMAPEYRFRKVQPHPFKDWQRGIPK